MSASTYLETALLNWFRGQNFLDTLSGTYVGLFDGDPTDSGLGGTEITEAIRSAGRPAVTFGAVSAGTITNNAEVDFGLSEADAEATHFGVFDAVTAGNMLAHGAITNAEGDPTTVIIGTDNTVTLPVSALPIDFD